MSIILEDVGNHHDRVLKCHYYYFQVLSLKRLRECDQ